MVSQTAIGTNQMRCSDVAHISDHPVTKRISAAAPRPSAARSRQPRSVLRVGRARAILQACGGSLLAAVRSSNVLVMKTSSPAGSSWIGIH